MKPTMKPHHWILIILLALSSVTIVAVPGMAQDIVYCQKFGDLSGQVYTFHGYCPLGYIRVK